MTHITRHHGRRKLCHLEHNGELVARCTTFDTAVFIAQLQGLTPCIKLATIPPIAKGYKNEKTKIN